MSKTTKRLKTAQKTLIGVCTERRRSSVTADTSKTSGAEEEKKRQSARRQSDALKSLVWTQFGLKMDSTDSTTKQVSDNNRMSEVTSGQQSDNDYKYEDDFEELDPKISHSGKQDIFHKSDTIDSQQEKGQRESSGQIPMEKHAAQDEKPTSNAGKPFRASAFDELQSDDSEPEPEGDVLFTNDQQRAMMELVAQKHDNGDYSEGPPEYNVKERIKELNAELAMEPDPDDRQHRVGFKAELVDMVAPPPDVSDDDDTPRRTLSGASHENKAGKETEGGGDKKKQYVIEREGKFDFVADNELTADERAMLSLPDEDGSSKTDINSNSSLHDNKERVQPVPPSKPRPNTASSVSLRGVRSSHSPRPKTASFNCSASSATSLRDFQYNSPYAMSPNEKERALERARLREQQKKEEVKRLQEEEKYRRQESDEAFQAWLRQKMEDDQRRKQDESSKEKDGKEDRSKDEEGAKGFPYIPYLEPFEPIFSLKPQLNMQEQKRAKENEEAFKGWLKQKQTQMKREKLLKKREDQDSKDGYYVRSREECEIAYKEWLKRKYAEFRRQREAEKARIKSFQMMARRQRKQQMLARAVRQSDAFRYVDYYGYRF